MLLLLIGRKKSEYLLALTCLSCYLFAFSCAPFAVFNEGDYSMTMNPNVPKKDDVVEQVDAAQKMFALPVVRFTFEHLQIMNEKRLSKVPCWLLLYCLGNMHTTTGSVRKFKVKDVCKFFGCKKTAIYEAIRTLREANLAALHLRYGTVSGKVLGTLPSRQLDIHYSQEDDESYCGETDPYNGHKLCVGQMHNTGVAAMIAAGTSGGWIRLAMAFCLNISLQTGELAEMRPSEWAEKAAIHRTWAVDGIQHLNESGFADVKVDYDVEGHVPCVAAASAYFNLRDASRNKRNHDVDEDLFAQRMTALYEAYGIQAKGWFKKMVENAWRLLGDSVDKVLEKSRQKMVDEFGLGANTVKHISRRNIINGRTLDMDEAEVIPFS